ncbi:hypothetical protein L6164_018057 [Bauhinia variegata]|uniref:Uncharacterized protein n=1 Tax=Bauhinia variegata TaxID=167791 RepID=A0ACB9NB71_BAUVA|nr:hypothetical protein L6164_018057 [Bauhinia variegata]
MNSCFNSTPLTAFTSHNSYNDHALPQAMPYGCISKTLHDHYQMSKRASSIVLSCQNKETMGKYDTPFSVSEMQKRVSEMTLTAQPQCLKQNLVMELEFLVFFGERTSISQEQLVFIEKILRTAPDVGKIFLLIKSKDQITALHRLETEEFMMSKLVPVAGNICESNLGMDAETANKIAREINVFVNSAANTTFYERYDVALNTNTIGPAWLLSFAKTYRKICLFLHISTAYVSGERQGIIKETPFYLGQTIARERETSDNQVSVPMLDIEAEIKLATDLMKSINESEATQEMKILGDQRAKIHGWHNTYSFTKAMGEMLINSTRGDIPVVIMRPTIIESTYNEPFPGWIQGYKVLDPIILAYGKGQLPGFNADTKTVLDVVPVDMVVNAGIAAIAKHGTRRSYLNVYHVASSVMNPISFGYAFKYSFDHFKSSPLLDLDGNEISISSIKLFSSMDSFSSYIARVWKAKLMTEAAVLEPQQHQKLERKYRKIEEYFIHMGKVYEPYMFFKGSTTLTVFACTNKTQFHHCHNQVGRPKTKRSYISIHSSQINKTEGNCNGSLSSSALQKSRKNSSIAQPPGQKETMVMALAFVLCLRARASSSQVQLGLWPKCELFKKLQEEHGKYYEGFMMRKLVPVAGNVCEPNLGMDADMANEIAKKADFIINSAACTNFDERITTPYVSPSNKDLDSAV